MLPSCSPIVPCICHLQLETATQPPAPRRHQPAPMICSIYLLQKLTSSVSLFPLLSFPVSAVLYMLKRQSNDLSSFVLQRWSWCNVSQELQNRTTTNWNDDAMLLLIQLLLSSNEADLILLPPNPTQTMLEMITSSFSNSSSSSSSSSV